MKTKALQWREILACLKDEALTEAEYAMAAESASAGFDPEEVAQAELNQTDMCPAPVNRTFGDGSTIVLRDRERVAAQCYYHNALSARGKQIFDSMKTAN